MKSLIPLILFFFLYTPIHAQQKTFTQTPVLGVHAAFFDLTGADTLKSFTKYSKPGLAIHFQNNIAPRLDYAITAAGSFFEFFNKNNSSLSNDQKKLLLETD